MTYETERALEESALDELDRDPASRKRFLKALGSSGAVATFGAVLAACGSTRKANKIAAVTSPATPPAGAPTPTDAFGKGDLGILGYALTLEYLEADFYKKAAASGKLTGRALAAVKRFGQEEQQHVRALESAIKKAGGKLPKKPKTTFPLTIQSSILKLAATLENLGAAAYLGQATRIQDKHVLAMALTIHSVEGRHAATLNGLTGKDVAPDGAFATPADAATVLGTVKPFIAS